MNLRLILPACASILLAASCTPYVEPPPEAPADPAARKMSDAEKKEKIREQRNEMKKEREGDELPEKKTTRRDPDGGMTGNSGDTPEKVSPKPKPKSDVIPVARPVPGKPGMVFSPFNNKMIDVKGIPTGKLVADPTYPASEKKHFRVP